MTSHLLELEPATRFDVIDVRGRLNDEAPEVAARPHALYASLHTTAGFLEQETATRLRPVADAARGHVERFRRLFPARAPYQHDQLHLRSELTDEQRRVEPLNGDAHLTFIGAGLQGCVTYRHHAESPVYLIDLDGTSQPEAADLAEEAPIHRRRRKAVVVGFGRERLVARVVLEVPVVPGPVDAVNLDEAHDAQGTGLQDRLAELLQHHGVATGRVDLALHPDERNAALTINEHETLLMRHDLAEVLRNPLHFALETGRRAARRPSVFARKTLDYFRYDAVKVVSRLPGRFGRGGLAVARLLAAIARPSVGRALDLRREVSMPLAAELSHGSNALVQGRYQSPILLQWRRPTGGRRRVVLSLHELD